MGQLATIVEGAGTFRSALASRSLRWLLTAFALSALGQTIGTVAITVVVYDRTGSAAWAAVAAAARLVPYLLCSGLAGVVADRCDRRRLLAASACARAVLAAASLVAVVLAAPVWLLVALTFALTAAGTPCYPTMAAVVPTTVGEGDLTPANGLLTTVEAGGFLIGPALGAPLLVAGPAAVLAVDAGRAGDKREASTQRRHMVPLLLAGGLRCHDLQGDALRGAHEGERHARASPRVLDHRAPRPQPSIRLGRLDHGERHAVLHAPRRILVFQLEENPGALLGNDMLEWNEPRSTDGVEHRHAHC